MEDFVQCRNDLEKKRFLLRLNNMEVVEKKGKVSSPHFPMSQPGFVACISRTDQLDTEGCQETGHSDNLREKQILLYNIK